MALSPTHKDQLSQTPIRDLQRLLIFIYVSLVSASSMGAASQLELQKPLSRHLQVW